MSALEQVGVGNDWEHGGKLHRYGIPMVGRVCMNNSMRSYQRAYFVCNSIARLKKY